MVSKILSKRKSRGQVWIETMIYTLIALAMIGAVLAFARPKIQELQDQAVIEQTVSLIESVDAVISSAVQGGPGNVRVVDIIIKEGTLNIDGINDSLIFEIESRHVFSEPGENVEIGILTARTEDKGRLNSVTLTRNYSNFNITFGGDDVEKLINKASIPYKISISNEGRNKYESGSCSTVSDCTSPPSPEYKAVDCRDLGGVMTCRYEGKNEIKFGIE